MTPAQDVAAQVMSELRGISALLREVGELAADSRRYLGRLCEYEEERRVEERRLAGLAESLLPSRSVLGVATPPQLTSDEWESVAWGEEQPSKIGLVTPPQAEAIDLDSDWWYRSTDDLTFRERGTDRRLSQQEIELILHPPGRERARRKSS